MSLIGYALRMAKRYYEPNTYDHALRVATYVANKKDCPEAFWVKLADIKDHLNQTETLTDKLKEKYLEAIPYLL